MEAPVEPSVEPAVEAPVESTVEAGEPAPERTRKHIESDDDDEEVQAPVEEQVTIDSSEDPKSQRQILEDRLDRLLKKTSGRRQRADEHDLEQYLDEKILRLKDEMNIAAQMDIETLNKRIEEGENKSQDKKPLVAIQKVKLLPKS